MRVRSLLGVVAFAVAACGGLSTALPTADDGGMLQPPLDAGPPPVDGAPLRRAAPTKRPASPIASTCFVVASGGLDTIDLELGTHTHGPKIPMTNPDAITTMGLHDTKAYVCEKTVWQVDVVTVSAGTSGDLACDAVLADDVSLVIIRNGVLLQYSDWLKMPAEPFASGPAGSILSARSALFYDQIFWVASDEMRLEKRMINSAASPGSVVLQRVPTPVRGLATTLDGRVVVVSSSGIETFDAFTGELLQQLTNDAASGYGAIACQPTVPLLGDCTRQPDGTYCSTRNLDAAYTCRGGRVVDPLWCPRGEVCNPDSDGHAQVVGGTLACRRVQRVDDGCTGLPDGTYCSLTNPYAFPCRGGAHAGSPSFCRGQVGTCQSGPDGKALLDSVGLPICTGGGDQ